jgi:hypothetical protein
MNRIQFFVLTGLSGLFFLLLMGNLYLGYSVATSQVKAANAQAFVSQAVAFNKNFSALAQVSQKSNDPALKDLLARQGITIRAASTNSTDTPATPPSR